MASASLQQRTPAWHAARRGKLTASNIGSVLGLCPWTSRLEALNRAMGLSKFEGNDATRWGTAHESDGILAYSAHTGNLVDQTGLHVHPTTTWLAGSPDGLVGTEGIIEVKCPFYRKKDGTRVHKEVPLYYYMQMQMCLEITGRKWCDFISWHPDTYVVYRVWHDPGLHDSMMPHYIKFFSAMQRMAVTPPPFATGEKDEICKQVKASLDVHVDYDHWSAVNPYAPPPSPTSDTEEYGGTGPNTGGAGPSNS